MENICPAHKHVSLPSPLPEATPLDRKPHPLSALPPRQRHPLPLLPPPPHIPDGKGLETFISNCCISYRGPSVRTRLSGARVSTWLSSWKTKVAACAPPSRRDIRISLRGR